VIELWHGDCLVEMNRVKDGSVDLIYCDLPFGVTACKWDEIIPFEPLWAHFKRVLKARGTVVAHGVEPFSSHLRLSNLEWYKYDWVWDKKICADFYAAKHRPMTRHEIMSVFSNGTCAQGGINAMTYNPVMLLRKTPRKYRDAYGANRKNPKSASLKNRDVIYEGVLTHRFPTSILQISNANQNGKVHPTQKPLALAEYILKTYSNEGDTVLDPTMGSGTAGVAAMNLGRCFIGIELDDHYFQVASEQIEKAQAEAWQPELV